MGHPLLLLPRALDGFILQEHAEDLVRSGDGAAVPPGRVPYGALVRAPAPLRGLVARQIARSIGAARPTNWSAGDTVLIAYHAIQWPVARVLLERGVAGDLWYARWDRYEAAHDAAADRHELLGDWHGAMAGRASLIFAVSDALADVDRRPGRDVITTPTSADAFPSGPLLPGGRGAELVRAAAPDGFTAASADGPVAVSLGHLGRRTDWAWLRGAAERDPELRLLLVGSWHEDEVGDDADYRWLRASTQVVWLGRLSDADAAAVIAEADVGLVPFTVDPFNSCGLPNRILKYARLGRPTIAPPLAGCATWDRAMVWADGPQALAGALRSSAGARRSPDGALREWALEQTVGKMNAPLLERLRS